MRWMKFLLAGWFIFNISFAHSEEKTDIAWSVQKECSLDSKVGLTQLDGSIQFELNGNDDEKDIWQLNDFVFKCAILEPDCWLYLKQTEIFHVNSNEMANVNELIPYLFQSAVEGYAYQVLLVEGAQERGSSWYYAMVLQNNKVINAFFIKRGRHYIDATEEYLALHPETDEMEINPKEFISIFIEGDQQIIFKLNEEYLYPEDEEGEIGSNTGFTCIERALYR